VSSNETVTTLITMKLSILATLVASASAFSINKAAFTQVWWSVQVVWRLHRYWWRYGYIVCVSTDSRKDMLVPDTLSARFVRTRRLDYDWVVAAALVYTCSYLLYHSKILSLMSKITWHPSLTFITVASVTF
jgi:hypothetical protein